MTRKYNKSMEDAIRINTTIEYEKLSTEQLYSALSILLELSNRYQIECDKITQEIKSRTYTIKTL